VAGMLVAVVMRGTGGRPEQRPATDRGRYTY